MGRGTVLVAEDSAEIRMLMGCTLRSGGYRVLEAPDGLAAFQIAELYSGFIDLLVTDVEMPRLDGPALSLKLRRRRPGLKVLFVSGRSREQLCVDAAVLAKPFTTYNLLRAVQRLLDHRNIEAVPGPLPNGRGSALCFSTEPRALGKRGGADYA